MRLVDSGVVVGAVMESCIYDDMCPDCSVRCRFYQKRRPLVVTLTVLFLVCAFLFLAGHFAFRYAKEAGREEGRQERVSRATCMQYAIQLEEQGAKYTWRKGAVK